MKEIILKEPYRVFFPLAVIAGLLGVGHWFFYGVGLIEHYSGFLHASIQMQVCIGCFIVGFLMTAIPRMSSTAHASGTEFAIQLGLTLFILGAYLLNAPLWGLGAYVLWLANLASFFIRRFKKRNPQKAPLASPPTEFVWIPAGILMSLSGALCVLFGQSSAKLVYFGQQMVNQSFVLAAVAGVGSFMGARLTGRFRSKKKVVPLCSPEAKVHVPKKAFVFQLVAILFFLVSFILEGLLYEQAAYFLRAVSLSACFLVSGVLPKWPRVSDLFAWLIWFSFWLVALGLWGVVAHVEYRKEALHVSFVGGLGLMTYAVATMVILSHAGKSSLLRKPLLIFWILLAGVMTALGFRLAAVFFPEEFFRILSTSSAIWIGSGVIWLLYVARYLGKVPEPGRVESDHEAMKKRVTRS